jgi:hypothetical protein
MIAKERQVEGKVVFTKEIKEGDPIVRDFLGRRTWRKTMTQDNERPMATTDITAVQSTYPCGSEGQTTVIGSLAAREANTGVEGDEGDDRSTDHESHQLEE